MTIIYLFLSVRKNLDILATSDILLIIPPFTQLNCAYPSTVLLNGFLRQNQIDSHQCDLGITTINRILSKEGLLDIFSQIELLPFEHDRIIKQMLANKEKYVQMIEPVKLFLQGKNSSLVEQISGNILPQGPRFINAKQIEKQIDNANIFDKAKFKATLFIEDIGDMITKYIDADFGFSRYAERLGIRAHNFDEIREAVNNESIITKWMYVILKSQVEKLNPGIIGISVPFHGNLIGALKTGNYIRQHYPGIKVIMGGGYVNTELRNLNEPGLFDFADYVTLDDGELPLLRLISYIQGRISIDKLVRTFYRDNQKVVYVDTEEKILLEHNQSGPPDYMGIEPDRYISVLEQVNPMHRLWTDGWWNKLMIAHGCYWHQCSFCDTSLDYIKRYSPANAQTLCNWIEIAIKQTGRNGFHFVDEAAPPVLLKNLAIELLKRNLKIRWWANIRFEPAFTPDICRLLALSGCIAVSGGLETASDRLLKLMNKGVSIEQVAHVTTNFTRAGIMLHAYLMYGFPTQSVQETIDSLEVVRQLFAKGLIQSAYWHRFALTVHSPVYRDSEKFGIVPQKPDDTDFSQNDCDFVENQAIDHAKFGFGLQKAVYNFMHGQCFDFKAGDWFNFKTPKTSHPPDLIGKIISGTLPIVPGNNMQLLWVSPQLPEKNNIGPYIRYVFAGSTKNISIDLLPNESQWLDWLINKADIHQPKLTFGLVAEKYDVFTGEDIALFITGKKWKLLLQAGLLVL